MASRRSFEGACLQFWRGDPVYSGATGDDCHTAPRSRQPVDVRADARLLHQDSSHSMQGHRADTMRRGCWALNSPHLRKLMGYLQTLNRGKIERYQYRKFLRLSTSIGKLICLRIMKHSFQLISANIYIYILLYRSVYFVLMSSCQASS